jgi:hypothetical protein
MLAPVTASHGLRPSASAQLDAYGKCSDNTLAITSSEAMSNKPEVRNSTVRVIEESSCRDYLDLWRPTLKLSGIAERWPLERLVSWRCSRSSPHVWKQSGPFRSPFVATT